MKKNKSPWHYIGIMIVLIIGIMVIGNIRGIFDRIDSVLFMKIVGSLFVILITGVIIQLMMKEKNDDIIDKY